MANQDFDFDEPKENNIDPTVESHLENGYQNNGAWWAWLPSSKEGPNQSIFPADDSPYWETGDIPQEIQEQYSNGDPCVQGWKLHLALNKEDIEKLFPVVSPILKDLRVMHKFSDVEDYKMVDDGKACAIYPVSPTQVDKIVRALDWAIGIHNTKARVTRGKWATNNNDNNNKIRPHSSGVKGDLALGNTGVIYCRYGAFTGGLAEAKKLYNPLKGDLCDETRGEMPYPGFIKTVPDEIANLIGTNSRWRPIISQHRPNDGVSKSNGGTATGSKSNGGTATGSPWTAARHRPR
jgi:hypothetical protein